MELWNELTPWIVIAKPSSDLCWTCQQYTQEIGNRINVNDSEKQLLLDNYLKHLALAKKEREYYQTQCQEAKDCYPEAFDPYSPPTPCSFNGTAHYSWDYAQQLHYPADPQQPGPIYFKTPRKCSIFGVSNDACNYQFNYLIDEIVATGKGANSTISYVHHYMATHGMGETKALIHADNCTGQNKNNFFIWYFAYRTIIGLNEEMEYSFMCVGHTKFSCDRCFGVLKKKTNRTELSSLYDVAEAVAESGDVNESELVGDHLGNVLVKVFDWSTWFEKVFRKLEGILKYSHFRFSHLRPGEVNCYIDPHGPPVYTKNLIKMEDVEQVKAYLTAMKPVEIIPEGFTEQRKAYLYNDIRQFCKEGSKDLVALAVNTAKKARKNNIH